MSPYRPLPGDKRKIPNLLSRYAKLCSRSEHRTPPKCIALIANTAGALLSSFRRGALLTRDVFILRLQILRHPSSRLLNCNLITSAYGPDLHMRQPEGTRTSSFSYRDTHTVNFMHNHVENSAGRIWKVTTNQKNNKKTCSYKHEINTCSHNHGGICAVSFHLKFNWKHRLEMCSIVSSHAG
jgi:hypothetical protein